MNKYLLLQKKLLPELLLQPNLNLNYLFNETLFWLKFS